MMDLPITIVSFVGIILILEYVDSLRERNGFQSDDRIVIPLKGSFFSQSPPGKVGVHVKTFDTCYCLLTTDFMAQFLHNNCVKIYKLTPDIFTKLMAFKMSYRTQGLLPDFWVFKNYFRLSTIVDKYIFLCIEKQSHPCVGGEQSP